LKNRVKRIYAYCLLILFMGYYGSITLFYHSHIVLGDTIVHSHPFRSDSHGAPMHSHTDNGYVTIHILASFTVAFIFLYFDFKTKAKVIYEIVPKFKHGTANHSFHYFYSLRAPPTNIPKKDSLLFQVQ
jgi:hypothetical protein